MIDAKQAVVLAKQKASDILGPGPYALEEYERETGSRDLWLITLSSPRNLDDLPPLIRLATSPVQYKRFVVDAETGEVIAMKLREPVMG